MTTNAYFSLKSLLDTPASKSAWSEVTPPTSAWLAKITEARNSLRLQVRWLLSTSVMLCIGALMASGLNPENQLMEQLLVGVLWVCIALVLATSYFILPLITRADEWVTSLYEGGHGAIAILLAEQVPACKSYQQKVQQLGREFVELDYLRMKELASRHAQDAHLGEVERIKQTLNRPLAP